MVSVACVYTVRLSRVDKTAFVFTAADGQSCAVPAENEPRSRSFHRVPGSRREIFIRDFPVRLYSTTFGAKRQHARDVFVHVMPSGMYKSPAIIGDCPDTESGSDSDRAQNVTAESDSLSTLKISPTAY